jgi:hypothetical protein
MWGKWRMAGFRVSFSGHSGPFALAFDLQCFWILGA